MTANRRYILDDAAGWRGHNPNPHITSPPGSKRGRENLPLTYPILGIAGVTSKVLNENGGPGTFVV